MYELTDSLSTNVSVSANLNNLTHLSYKNGNYLAVHDCTRVSVLNIGTDDNNWCKEIIVEQIGDDNRTFIQRIKLIRINDKTFLTAVTSQNVKVFSLDENCSLIYNYNFNIENKTAQTIFGISTISKCSFGVATQSKVYFFGKIHNNWKFLDVQQELRSNTRFSIYSFESDGKEKCAVAESNGTVTLWKYEESSKCNFTFIKLIFIDIHPNTKSTGLLLYNNLVVLGTVSGQIQLISIETGVLLCEIQAHVRCITAFDIAQDGLLVTTSEDSHIRLFRLNSSENELLDVEHLTQITIEDEMICGVKFLNSEGSQFATCSYESSLIKLFQLNQQ